MRRIHLCVTLVIVALSMLPMEVSAKVYFSGWTTTPDAVPTQMTAYGDDPVSINTTNYFQPYTLKNINKKRMAHNEKVIIVDPRKHTWKAFSADGKLLRSGMATAGSHWCSDIGRPCRTRVGTFRIHTLGGANCKSSKFPVGRGGAPMPYCMFFNGGQGLHGSHEVVYGNISHGCVRLHVNDARWIRFNFATIGTKVIVKPY